MERPLMAGNSRTAWTADEAVHFVLEKGILSGPCDVMRMAGGYWNDVLRIRSAERTLILKAYRDVLPGTLFPNLPDSEALALERLSGLAVAPERVGYWPQERVLVYEYVDGVPWDGDVEAMAELLLRKEAADPAGFRQVPLQPRDILAEGDSLFARTAPDETVEAFRIARPADDPIEPPPRLSLLHTDIGATNLIGSGAALRLIDWQCPGAGDLAEDVYSFLSPAFQILNLREPLTDGERRRFFAGLGRPDVEDRHRRLEPAFAYRMAGYCCLRYQTAEDEAVRARYRRAAAAELLRMRPA